VTKPCESCGSKIYADDDEDHPKGYWICRICAGKGWSKLTAERVEAIVIDCLFADEEAEGLSREELEAKEDREELNRASELYNYYDRMRFAA